MITRLHGGWGNFIPFNAPFNPHANGSAAIKMVKNMDADGARQNARMAGRRKDVGTHIPPAPDPK
jgi:hypothetical protein